MESLQPLLLFSVLVNVIQLVLIWRLVGRPSAPTERKEDNRDDDRTL